jgi:classical protein kinase C
MPSQRKPLSGHLSIRVHAVADVDHAATSRFSRGPETFVVMKVEDAAKGRTKASRTDRWTDEVHDFDVDKANEVEITVYDRTGDHPLPIGMLWLRISDIAEEMRRKRIETELQNSGWVSADKMADGGQPRPDLQFNPPPGQNFQQGGVAGSGGIGPGGGMNVVGGPTPQTGPVFIDAWFSLEPAGRIQLTMSFGKDSSYRIASSVLTASSETKQGSATIRCRFGPQGSYSTTQRGGPRAIRAQIRAATIL